MKSSRTYEQTLEAYNLRDELKRVKEQARYWARHQTCRKDAETCFAAAMAKVVQLQRRIEELCGIPQPPFDPRDNRKMAVVKAAARREVIRQEWLAEVRAEFLLEQANTNPPYRDS